MNSIIPITQETKHKLHVEAKSLTKAPSFTFKGGHKVQVVQINKNSIFKVNSSPLHNDNNLQESQQYHNTNENVRCSPKEESLNKYTPHAYNSEEKRAAK